ncbi:MAG: hypothetical protein IJE75_05715 [Firmicutes bacterium]|nr:hypothetical protein [Bacillota bacterium]
MKRIGTKRPLKDALAVIVPLAAVGIIILFMSLLNDIDSGRNMQAIADLENSLKKASLACYASEGIDPPDVAYLEEHYGIQVDEDRFWVDYKVFASNIMPEITVLRKDEQ